MHQTFDQIATEILSRPDCAVEIEEMFIGSTHIFVTAQREIIRAKKSAGIDLRYDHESMRAKGWLSAVLVEIEAGRTNAVKSPIYNPLS